MDEYNVFVGCTQSTLSSSAAYLLASIFRELEAQIVVANCNHLKPLLIKEFPEELSLKIENYNGNLIENFCQFCDDYPSEWVLLVLPGRPIGTRAVEKYKRFWGKEVDTIFVPTDCEAFSADLSGHLMFMNYYAYRRLDRKLSLGENLYELGQQGLNVKSIHGIILRNMEANSHG